ncbi:hypothetical protein DEO72_LG4g1195 [Vigna unguiculata]|uniref:Uncharacterized protein n=1 Tax=Vigna unguiculata TaxID=3917 RepID=A0A4D6LP08_VIGUN|nr:hypothetical protein DEO72_LG4g1195 [Vigna unguiculata]
MLTLQTTPSQTLSFPYRSSARVWSLAFVKFVQAHSTPLFPALKPALGAVVFLYRALVSSSNLCPDKGS